MNTNNSNIQIGNRSVGYDFDPLIIAEIGINHGGNIDVAKKMVDAASSVGVEVIKHQTHVVDDEMSHVAKMVKPGNANASIYEIMRSCALQESEERELKEYVEKKGMIFLSTPFSRMAADRLEAMGVVAYKIGSGECNNLPLISHIANFGKPMIISTGMNDMKSIQKTIALVENQSIPYVLLHTTNLYPTPPKLVRLGAMTEMALAFPNVPFGLSDHTTDNLACFGAVALGASVLERHFTDHKDRIGPDIICSMDPKACRELIEGSRILKQERGGNKRMIPEEQVTADFAFASIVTIKMINEGEAFSEKNLWVKRPGKGGIASEHFDEILGKKATKCLNADIQLSWSDIR